MEEGQRGLEIMLNVMQPQYVLYLLLQQDLSGQLFSSAEWTFNKTVRLK